MFTKNIFFLISLILISCNQNASKLESSEASTLNEVQPNQENVDIEEKIPEEISLGSQTWKTQNAIITTFANGELIPQVINANEWFLAGENKQPAMCYYNNDPSTADELGVLYNFYAISDPRGIASDGWKIPDINDIKELNRFLDNNLRSEMGIIMNKESQGVDVEEYWKTLNEKYQDYCPVNLYPELKYLTQKIYISRDWKGKFESFETDAIFYKGFWTLSTTEVDIYNEIHYKGLYFNLKDCWRFKYSTFYNEIEGRQSTAEVETTDFNHRGFVLRFIKK
jgi:uncharacterized protein (TIGR02145 family)